MDTTLQIDSEKKKIYAPLLNEWVNYSREEELKQNFILCLANTYGYSLDQLGQKVKIKNRYEADIAIWRNKADKEKKSIPSIIIMVKGKDETIRLKESDYSVGYNFASFINANFFIAVNLKETKVFHIKNDISIKNIEKLSEIPKAKILTNNRTIENYVNDNRRFIQYQLTKLLIRSHNIIRNNYKIPPDVAFDEYSKVLFMKIMFGRNSKEEMLFSIENFKAELINYEERIRPELKKFYPHLDKDYVEHLFDKAKEKIDADGLFDIKDRIKISRSSFEMIVQELKTVNLSDTSDNIHGFAFEQFLVQTFRGELGQFFTPRTIVDFIIKILDPQEGETICDPCCGSGGFLISAFEYIKDKIDIEMNNQIKLIKKKYYNANFEKLSLSEQEKVMTKVQSEVDKIYQEFDLNNSDSRYHKLFHKSIYGTDKNPRMARTAKMNMIMNRIGHDGIHHNNGFLNVNGIFDGRFDVILTNPPFGSKVEKSDKVTESDLPSKYKIDKYKSQYENYIEKVVDPISKWANWINKKDNSKGKPIIDLFQVSKWSTSTEILFIERCLNLLKPGGRMGIVLPEGVLNNSRLQKTREFIESRAKIVLITSIPQNAFIASGVNIKPSIVFLKKFTEEELRTYQEIELQAKKEIKDTYDSKINELRVRLSLKGKEALTFSGKELLKKELKKLELKIESEIRAKVKQDFDYQIPIAEVEKAGISATGTKIENELEPLAKEFTKYRRVHNLWKVNSKEEAYGSDENGSTIENLLQT